MPLFENDKKLQEERIENKILKLKEINQGLKDGLVCYTNSSFFDILNNLCPKCLNQTLNHLFCIECIKNIKNPKYHYMLFAGKKNLAYIDTHIFP
jgi:predicted amidophosphoribosyltransferase